MTIVRLRMQRFGHRNYPTYRIVATKSTSSPRGKFLEILGSWRSIPDPTGTKYLRINTDRVKYWLSTGAQPSDTVAKLLSKANLLPEQPRRIQMLAKDFYTKDHPWKLPGMYPTENLVLKMPENELKTGLQSVTSPLDEPVSYPDPRQSPFFIRFRQYVWGLKDSQADHQDLSPQFLKTYAKHMLTNALQVQQMYGKQLHDVIYHGQEWIEQQVQSFTEFMQKPKESVGEKSVGEASVGEASVGEGIVGKGIAPNSDIVSAVAHMRVGSTNTTTEKIHNAVLYYRTLQTPHMTLVQTLREYVNMSDRLGVKYETADKEEILKILKESEDNLPKVPDELDKKFEAFFPRQPSIKQKIETYQRLMSHVNSSHSNVDLNELLTKAWDKQELEARQREKLTGEIYNSPKSNPFEEEPF